MGYDITFVPIYEVSNWITKTGKNPDEMCYDDYSKFEENECTYLSYNFAIFRELWFARDNFGKTSEEFAESLRKASRELTKKKISDKIPSGIYEETGEPFDAW